MRSRALALSLVWGGPVPQKQPHSRIRNTDNTKMPPVDQVPQNYTVL